MQPESATTKALQEIDFRLSLLHMASPGDAPLPQVAEIEQLLSMVLTAPALYQ